MTLKGRCYLIPCPIQEPQDLFVQENSKVRDPSRQHHSKNKLEKLEAFWEASPGAVPPGYETQKGAELAFANYCAHEGETRGAIAKRLSQFVHAKERGDEYIQATADKAVKGAENSKKKVARKALAKAEELARFAFLAAIGTLKKSADKSIFERVADRERMGRALRVLFAHFRMQQEYRANVSGEVEYLAPWDKVAELSGVGSNYIGEAHKYLEDHGWITCTRPAVKWRGPKYPPPSPPWFKLGDVPEQIKRAFKDTPLYSRLLKLKFFTEGVSPQWLSTFRSLLIYGRSLTTTMKPVDTSEEKPASYGAIPPHRTFWVYRALLEATPEGFTLSDIQHLTAQSKATVWRHLTILAEMGLARRGERGWEAIVPGLEAAPTEEAAPAAQQAEPIPATYMKLLESVVQPMTPTRTLSPREKVQRDKKILGVGGYYNGADDEYEYVALATG